MAGILRIPATSLDDLVKYSEAIPGGMTPQLSDFVDELIEKGRYTIASEDEIDAFEKVFNAAYFLNTGEEC